MYVCVCVCVCVCLFVCLFNNGLILMGHYSLDDKKSVTPSKKLGDLGIYMDFSRGPLHRLLELNVHVIFHICPLNLALFHTKIQMNNDNLFKLDLQR